MSIISISINLSLAQNLNLLTGNFLLMNGELNEFGSNAFRIKYYNIYNYLRSRKYKVIR